MTFFLKIYGKADCKAKTRPCGLGVVSSPFGSKSCRLDSWEQQRKGCHTIVQVIKFQVITFQDLMTECPGQSHELQEGQQVAPWECYPQYTTQWDRCKLEVCLTTLILTLQKHRNTALLKLGHNRSTWSYFMVQHKLLQRPGLISAPGSMQRSCLPSGIWPNHGQLGTL